MYALVSTFCFVITEVLSDVMGMTGQAIIHDIVAGQRDAQALARHRSGGIKASAEELCKALSGNWRAEHLFALEAQQSSWLVRC